MKILLGESERELWLSCEECLTDLRVLASCFCSRYLMTAYFSVIVCVNFAILLFRRASFLSHCLATPELRIQLAFSCTFSSCKA